MEISDGLYSSKIHVTRMSPLRHCSIGRREDEYDEIGDDIKKSEVIFSNKSECYCISMIDIVGSTQITSKLYNSGKIKKFYTVFINEIADIVKLHDGKILKTVGDGVIFFFPKTSAVDNIDGFGHALECLLNMVSSRHIINAKLHKEFLPDISYRISADYGKLEVAMSGEISSSYDLFGPTINFCAKINKKSATKWDSHRCRFVENRKFISKTCQTISLSGNKRTVLEREQIFIPCIYAKIRYRTIYLQKVDIVIQK